MGSRAKKVADWLSRWGFATLVAIGALAAASVASQVDVPAEIPSFALQAAPVYCFEVGTAVFAGIYLVSMSLILALNNRAFSEIGTSGIKAQEISQRQDHVIARQEEELKALTQTIDALQPEFDQDDPAGG